MVFVDKDKISDQSSMFQFVYWIISFHYIYFLIILSKLLLCWTKVKTHFWMQWRRSGGKFNWKPLTTTGLVRQVVCLCRMVMFAHCIEPLQPTTQDQPQRWADTAIKHTLTSMLPINTNPVCPLVSNVFTTKLITSSIYALWY